MGFVEPVLSLKELINRCLARDRAAWNEFILRFKAIVEKSIRARFRRHNFQHTIEDVKDITQSIFLDIWEHNKLGAVRYEDKIVGWLVIIAQNATIDFIRAQAKFRRQQSFFIDSQDNPQDITDTLASDSNPLKELMQDDLTAVLDTLIDSLGKKEKLILKLNIQYNMTHKEIARLTKISINTVSSILRRTMLHFRGA